MEFNFLIVFMKENLQNFISVEYLAEENSL